MNTVNKHCKSMLRYIKINVSDDGIIFADFYPRYSQVSGLSMERVASLFKKLREGGYVRLKKATNGKVIGFTLDHRGFWTKEDNIERFKAFLLKSILVPIVVAIIVAFITASVAATVNGWSEPNKPENPQSQSQPEPTLLE